MISKIDQRNHAESTAAWISRLYIEAINEDNTPERRAYLSAKYEHIRLELAEKAAEIIGDVAFSKSAMWLYAMIATEEIIRGQYESRRMHANAQMAHNQLKNWK